MTSEYVTLSPIEELKDFRGARSYDNELYIEQKSASDMRRFLLAQAASITSSIDYLRKQILGTGQSAIEELATLRLRLADGESDPQFTNWATQVEEKIAELKALGKQLEIVNEALKQSDRPAPVAALTNPEVCSYFDKLIKKFDAENQAGITEQINGRNANLWNAGVVTCRIAAAKKELLLQILKDLGANDEDRMPIVDGE